MTRYAPGHKQETRARLVKLAADRLRGGGLSALSVAPLMAEAGLTHGGFYAHFKSRDALAEEAISQLFAEALEAIDAIEARHGPQALGRYQDYYLSPRHRDTHAGEGCPVPILSAEMRSAPPGIRAAFEKGLSALADRLGQLTGPGGAPLGRADALGLLGEMAGVLALSRALSDPARSTQLLKGARKALAA